MRRFIQWKWARFSLWEKTSWIRYFFALVLVFLTLFLMNQTAVVVQDAAYVRARVGYDNLVAQRNALSALRKYGFTGEVADFQKFQRAMSQPKSYAVLQRFWGNDSFSARHTSEPLSVEQVPQQWVNAGGSPRDIERLMWLSFGFDYFGFTTATQPWGQKTAELTHELNQLGASIQQSWQARSMFDVLTSTQHAEVESKIDDLSDRIENIGEGLVQANLVMTNQVTTATQQGTGLLGGLLVVCGLWLVRRRHLDGRRLERTLKHNEERWRFAVNGANDAMWDHNVETGEWFQTERWITMLGLDPKYPIRDHWTVWFSAVHEDDRDAVLEHITQVQKGSEDRFEMRYRVRHTDGFTRHFLTRGKVLWRNAEGAPMRTVGINTDITQQVKAEENILHLAYYDGLTNLMNRASFDHSLALEIKRAERAGSSFTLMSLDLDHFKEINDGFGSEVGDALLREVANRLKGTLREYDIMARIGSDEFRIIVNYSDGQQADAIVQKLLKSLEVPFLIANERIMVTASAGLAVFPSDACVPDALILCANQAMFAVKQAGRNSYRYFTPAMQTKARQRRELMAEMHDAVRLEQFFIAYQPIVRLSDEKVYKAEALIRWNHPTRGVLLPHDFLPVAEASNLINEIGQWVFDQAQRDNRLFQQLFGADFQVSVNKSARQFDVSSNMDPLLQQTSNDIPISRRGMCVEITERLMTDMGDQFKSKLLAYRKAGIRISMDDFGTGYSSLAYLKESQIDYLKIDQSFVKSLEADANDAVLCEAMVAMAHKLGITVIAEGVETVGQRDLLQNMGCDYAQGFLYSPALPVSDFQVWLSDRRLKCEGEVA